MVSTRADGIECLVSTGHKRERVEKGVGRALTSSGLDGFNSQQNC